MKMTGADSGYRRIHGLREKHRRALKLRLLFI